VSHVKALFILLVYSTIFIVGTPGLDFLSPDPYPAERQAQFRQRYGRVLTAVGLGLVDLNRTVRRPLAKKIGDFQTVFRIRQSWHLYRDGPHAIRRLEIRVDGHSVYRTNHDRHNWLEPQLKSRRLRPRVEMTTKKFKSANWRGLSRYVVAQARIEWPDAKRVELVALSGPRPGTTLKTTHRITAEAPDWVPEKTQ
jgi:hypothetical protein